MPCAREERAHREGGARLRWRWQFWVAGSGATGGLTMVMRYRVREKERVREREKKLLTETKERGKEGWAAEALPEKGRGSTGAVGRRLLWWLERGSALQGLAIEEEGNGQKLLFNTQGASETEDSRLKVLLSLSSSPQHYKLSCLEEQGTFEMAKRLMQIANAEGLQVNEVAVEELAERVNGDMRMALNQLQYMSLSMSVIKYDDIRQRLLSSAKDEDISPFTAVDKLFGFNAGKLRMDERMDLSMSDPDLVPLLIQENYINYKPSSVGKDDNGIKRMNLIAHSAESIGDGDIINVQIRRYRQWQLSQSGSLASSIIPAALLHGQRETLELGERNFNRFGGWLGKNSTMGKNRRLLEDLHVHLLASRESSSGRENLRVEYLTLLLKQLTEPLRVLHKDEAVQKVVEFMNIYSITQEDFDTIVELSKFRGHPNPLDGIQPAVKAALTKAYKEGSKSGMLRAADLVMLPGMRKAPKKRIAAMLEPSDDGFADANVDTLAENERENSSDSEDLDSTANGEKLQLELQSLNSKGVQVELDLKGTGNSGAKKTPVGRGKGGSGPTEKKGGRGAGAGAKRKR